MDYKKILKYAGQNGEYYGKFLKHYHVSKDFLSWNWTAFFFLPFLLLYRKLWKEFFLLLLLSSIIVAAVYGGTAIFEVYTLGKRMEIMVLLFILITVFLTGWVSFLLSLRVNALYLQKAEKVMKRGEFNKGAGRSLLALWTYIVVVLLAVGFSVWFTIEAQKSYQQTRYSSYQASDPVDQKLEELQRKLDNLTYNEKWDEVKAVIEKEEDLTELSKIDYMFKIVFSLINHKKEDLLAGMIEKKLSIAMIERTSGRDFKKHCLKRKNWKMLRIFMTKGAFEYRQKVWIKANGYEGDRAMQDVVKSKDLETLKWLLEKKIPVKAKYYKGKSPLMLAVEAENLEMIQLLVKAGANPNYESLREGVSAIALSQKCKNPKIRAYFESQISASTFTIKMLNEAIEKEDLPLVKRIVESGLNVRQKEKVKWGKLPLEVAVEKENVTILDYLLSHGVEVNQVWNESKNTTLAEMISSSNAMELMHCALKYGATPTVDALDRAFAPRGDWLNRAKLLIEHNVSLIEPINRQQQLALHASLEHKDDALSNMIIDKMVQEGNGKYLSAKDKYGDTPLHYAVWNNKVKTVKKLVSLGVNTKVMSNQKVQAISYADSEILLKFLEPYSDHQPSISDSYCMVYVEKKFDKSKVHYCQTIANYYESIKDHDQAIWYYFLANDLASVKRYSNTMSWIKECNCKGYYAYLDIAHAYLLSDDIENTTKYYELLIEFSKSDHEKKWMIHHFEVLEGLHKGYGKKAKSLWRKVWRKRFKEDFFELYKIKF